MLYLWKDQLYYKELFVINSVYAFQENIPWTQKLPS
jgi:hypothetical protein